MHTWGVTVKHRSRVAADPNAGRNLRSGALDPLGAPRTSSSGPASPIETWADGENVTTRGVDLLGLPTGTPASTSARFKPSFEVTGLRNPCMQLEGHPEGADGRQPG